MNRITIEPTKFIDVRTGDESYGFRAYDDYGQTYCNTMKAIPDDDLEFFALVVSEYVNETLGAMLTFVYEEERSIGIGNQFYSYEQIKHIIQDRYE